MYYPITGYVLMGVLVVVGALVYHHRGDETLSIITGEYERCAPEWCSLTSMGPPHHATHEELIGVYHLVPVTIKIKSNLVTIPHLCWTRLDVL